ncbi:hypothetical protein GCM10011504_55760 [Siccirubricoccus deserti]|uniref:DUF2214 domain-containing protein n=1 Tax=Siccirubricoccus deserti TaxID=2013562 RepID=A0A9X0UGL7_9PROT|nr:DUF2214 domain-containing protein [Siccirubricoccus deserti]MBC4019078.1 DUF2214 domain-containing protein [Siccirubricoccus deserti]GGC70848.1 hypothetical protein GCM10011504_55760 [Siccirubricoccus deserti]
MLDAIAGWPVGAWLRASDIAYPLVNAAHIASIGLLLGAIVTLDLRLLGAFRRHPIGHLAPPLVRVAAAGLLAAAVTGLLLFSTRPTTYLENPAFLAKLALVGLALLNAMALRLHPWWRSGTYQGEAPGTVRAAVAVSLVAWPSAVVAGRWIGFLQ